MKVRSRAGPPGRLVGGAPGRERPGFPGERGRRADKRTDKRAGAAGVRVAPPRKHPGQRVDLTPRPR
ncbi:hypothetical protein CRV15_28185 (plasmid) [Streptomyces clavuligerus]|uniref:Uncharacterized protein n=1 Tax=Streptomyces clavuligerus TaxID=1901 RepID=B5GVW2_STRCL|nr:hypothetical protein SSCG_03605 [Streptomyces clavuligerus]EFG03500.1 Hypothetical protein SCLAV_p0005 [Streptomyces clavuligerus]QCS09543.1 hypothetical protein CRV15_28185 [Streptomyces clavuligerus]QPJ98405.1 hypothetical protein GE265_36115 [Streptomyces clavuligerus]